MGVTAADRWEVNEEVAIRPVERASTGVVLTNAVEVFIVKIEMMKVEKVKVS